MHGDKPVQIIELNNPLAEFIRDGPVITRAALDNNCHPTGDLQVIAPVELFVKAQARSLAPQARRFMVPRGLMYQDTPAIIRRLVHALVTAARRGEE